MTDTQQNKLETARETLRRAAAESNEKRKQASTKQELIIELRSDIVKLRSQGWTWRQIADTLHDTVDASADTIRIAITSKKKNSAASKPKADPASSHVLNQTSDLNITETRSPKRFGPPDL